MLRGLSIFAAFAIVLASQPASAAFPVQTMNLCSSSKAVEDCALLAAYAQAPVRPSGILDTAKCCATSADTCGVILEALREMGRANTDYANVLRGANCKEKN